MQHVSANYIVLEALRDVPRANTTRSPCRPPGCHPDLVPLSRHRSTPPWTRRGPVLLSDCRSLDSTAAFTQQSQILSNQYPSCRVLSAPGLGGQRPAPELPIRPVAKCFLRLGAHSSGVPLLRYGTAGDNAASDFGSTAVLKYWALKDFCCLFWLDQVQ